MSEKKADILVWGPMHASLMHNLERDYSVH